MPIQFLPLPILFAFSPPYHLQNWQMMSPSPTQQRITSIQQFGPPPAEFKLKTYPKQSPAPTAIPTKHFEKRGKGFLSSGPEWSRRHRKRGRHGHIMEDVKQSSNRGDFEEQQQNSYESSRRRFEQLWHPTFGFPRGKLRKNSSPDSKRMRQLVEELQQLKQEEGAKQLKQKQAKVLNPEKVEKHENTTNKEGEKDHNRGVGKGGKHDNTDNNEKDGDISLLVAQGMNTVFMEGDNTTQGFHFRL